MLKVDLAAIPEARIREGLKDLLFSVSQETCFAGAGGIEPRSLYYSSILRETDVNRSGL
jgi:hypothetical protein